MNINQFLYVDSLIALLESKSTGFPIDLRQLRVTYDLPSITEPVYEDAASDIGRGVLDFFGFEHTPFMTEQFTYLMLCPPILTQQFHISSDQFRAVYHVEESPESIRKYLTPFWKHSHASLETKVIHQFTDYFTSIGFHA